MSQTVSILLLANIKQRRRARDVVPHGPGEAANLQTALLVVIRLGRVPIAVPGGGNFRCIREPNPLSVVPRVVASGEKEPGTARFGDGLLQTAGVLRRGYGGQPLTIAVTGTYRAVEIHEPVVIHVVLLL